MKGRVLLALLLASALTGCALDPLVKPAMPKVTVPQRQPGPVALLVVGSPESFRAIQRLPSVCFGETSPSPDTLKRVFAETVEHAMTQVFERVTKVGAPAAVKGHPILVEAQMTAFVERHGCLASPGNYKVVEGRIRAVTDSGEEIWRGTTVSQRSDWPMWAMSLGEVARQYSESITRLVEAWAEELARVSLVDLAREQTERKAREEAERVAKVRAEAERVAREQVEQIAKARADAERAARQRAEQDATARLQAAREAQARAEREAKEAASGLAGADWARRRPLAEAAVAQAAGAEARGDAGGALRAYHRAWLLVYRDEDEALRGRVEEALARLAARLADKPPVDEAARRHAVQGDAYFDARRFDEAATAYTRLLAVAPWHAVGRYNLALALAAQERYGEAIAEMRRFLLLVPDGPPARTAQDTIYQWETRLR